MGKQKDKKQKKKEIRNLASKTKVLNKKSQGLASRIEQLSGSVEQLDTLQRAIVKLTENIEQEIQQHTDRLNTLDSRTRELGDQTQIGDLPQRITSLDRKTQLGDKQLNDL
ncbi:MAG: hypothetical protein GY731_17910, partial [Gammaproteobacteria bacterium]|nr:hypothetical protein [Gammaproteobacteria bacterium]